MFDKFCVLALSLATLFIAFSFESYSQQSPDLQNISSLNVNELTDEQIMQFVQKVESSGYSEEQLIVLARARGMSDSQLAALRKRIDDVTNKSAVSSSNEDIKRLRESPDIERVERNTSELDPFSSITPVDSTETDDELEIFGMSFFKNKNLSFEPSLNVPTPENYILGPGDGILIDIWGAFQYSYDLTITPEGVIRIEDVGPVTISGLTVSEGSKKIRQRLKSIYSSLGKNAFADISLGNLRTINVNVVGEVESPGTYTTSSFASAFNALYLAGGPNENGSLRVIEIFRSGKKLATLDAYQYLVHGTGNNITLQDQDVLLIRPYTNRVSLYGEVKRPSIYEMTGTESLADLVSYSGGFTGDAFSDRVTLRRNKGNFRAVSTVENFDFDNFELQNGDILEVKSISNLFINRVSIEGAVFQPGEYELIDSLTLTSLIQKAGGLRGDAFLNRAIILRQNDDLSMSSKSISLKELIAGTIDDELLMKEDLVRIQSIYDLREENFVQIQGEVLNPGKYPFVMGQTVEDLIFLAGGFKESASKSFVEVARRIDPDSTKNTNHSAKIFNFKISEDLKLNGEASRLELKPYDIIAIRRSPFYQEQEVIIIEGEVQYPGNYALEKKDERISSVLQRAGGITDFAYPKGATLIRRSEYYKGDSSAVLKEAPKIRREDMSRIFKKDSLFSNEDEIFRQQEFIGLNIQAAMKSPGSEHDLILREGDIISMPRQFQTVRLRGEVLYPSNIRFDESKNFKKYISQSGGFDQMAKKSKAYVVYPNGSSAQTRSFLFFRNYPKIEPGSEIVIPRKPDRQPMSPQGWIAISTSVATLALVIKQLTE
ncbi:MAG: SLBB domain-containing protein [Reichenbachiella sp.]